MAEDKTQVNFKVTAQDIAAIDALAKIDGYDNRSAWVRTHLRAVINARRGEIATVTALPRPAGAQVIPVVTVQAAGLVMIDNCPFTTSALMTLRDALIAFRTRKAAEKLAAERAQAAYGENAKTDLTLIQPVGAGSDK